MLCFSEAALEALSWVLFMQAKILVNEIYAAKSENSTQQTLLNMTLKSEREEIFELIKRLPE